MTRQFYETVFAGLNSQQVDEMVAFDQAPRPGEAHPLLILAEIQDRADAKALGLSLIELLKSDQRSKLSRFAYAWCRAHGIADNNVTVLDLETPKDFPDWMLPPSRRPPVA